jgi:putative FmdB family regulatory protein
MPIYVYRCSRCEKTSELLVRSAAEERSVRCPECQSDAVERQWATFAVGSSRSDPGPADAPFCGRCGENRPPCDA